MERHGARRDLVLELLEQAGGLTPGVAREISARTGIPEADVYGVATFYSLVARPDVGKRVCKGLSCRMAGSDDVLHDLEAAGHNAEGVSCLGQCDRAPAVLDKNLTLHTPRPRGPVSADNHELAINLGGSDDTTYGALAKARAMEPNELVSLVKASGLQGRGGAGFSAGMKWGFVRGEAETTRYLVVNADEGEPGTFKDREVMLRRPHRMLEGMLIAAHAVGAQKAFIYIRGEFLAANRSISAAITHAQAQAPNVHIEVVAGHGAYICGEETALLEAIEGRRGMPRLKPPYPTHKGLWNKPTLMNNVETLACVPSIVERGADWFRQLGRGEAGTKLYCISGHVAHPGTYELPLGVCLDELVEAAGGYLGNPVAFSPGGASSGFLPMSHRTTPLDFGSLSKAGAMLGSAGVVVLNDTVDLAQAVKWQLEFFEDETCGQCAPCRIGCSLQHQAVKTYLQTGDPASLAHVDDVAWEMEAGSICGLGVAASLPLTSARKYFGDAFRDRRKDS
jgi:NADH:ubiquinone oxidoreductase subunit F (NADH-binding)